MPDNHNDSPEPDRRGFFYALTPERVLQAVEQGGFVPSGHCSALNSLENRVYDVRLEDGRHVVAKFYRPARWSRAQIEAEHEFLYELREADIPVCAPLRFADGNSIQETAGIYYALWPRTGGRAVDELDAEQTRVLGRLLARIHNVGAGRPESRRLQLNAATYIEAPLKYLLESELIPAYLSDRYAAAAREMAQIYTELSADVPTHRIHGDCHAGNLLYGAEGWFFLDFDDFLTGPAVQDVWMLLPARDDAERARRAVFLEGYRTFREFSDHWLNLIEPLRAMRYVHYAAWIARRREDPAFPQAFPHFGSDEYWEQETLDLEEQVQICIGAQASLREHTGYAKHMAEEMEAEAELTNKDFFWDWEQD